MQVSTMRRNRRPRKPTHRALALCGGGILGAAFELGWLAAWEDEFGENSIQKSFDSFIGVSAGATVATVLAAGIPASRMVKSLSEGDWFFPLGRKDVFQFSPSQPIRWAVQLGRSLRAAAARGRHRDHRHEGSELAFHLREALPAGFFSLRDYERFLAEFLKRAAIPSEFSKLPHRLFIVATDLDLAERAVFGPGRMENVPIPRAIAASSAIPIFYEPVKIDGRYYIDGAMGQVGHVDIAIEEGAKDILVINPLVPIRNDGTKLCIPHLNKTCASIADRGFFSVWDQAMRLEIQTKLHLGLARFASENPDVRIECAEPPQDSAILFLHNPMDFAARKQVIQVGREAFPTTTVFGRRR